MNSQPTMQDTGVITPQRPAIADTPSESPLRRVMLSIPDVSRPAAATEVAEGRAGGARLEQAWQKIRDVQALPAVRATVVVGIGIALLAMAYAGLSGRSGSPASQDEIVQEDDQPQPGAPPALPGETIAHAKAAALGGENSEDEDNDAGAGGFVRPRSRIVRLEVSEPAVPAESVAQAPTAAPAGEQPWRDRYAPAEQGRSPRVAEWPERYESYRDGHRPNYSSDRGSSYREQADPAGEFRPRETAVPAADRSFGHDRAAKRDSGWRFQEPQHESQPTPGGRNQNSRFDNTAPHQRQYRNQNGGYRAHAEPAARQAERPAAGERPPFRAWNYESEQDPSLRGYEQPSPNRDGANLGRDIGYPPVGPGGSQDSRF